MPPQEDRGQPGVVERQAFGYLNWSQQITTTSLSLLVGYSVPELWITHHSLLPRVE